MNPGNPIANRYHIGGAELYDTETTLAGAIATAQRYADRNGDDVWVYDVMAQKGRRREWKITPSEKAVQA